MTVTERVAYLKGLFEGLGMDAKKSEGKLFQGMLDAMEEMAKTIVDLEEQNAELSSAVDEIYEDLSALEEDYYEDGDAEDALDLQQEGDLYQVICPTCEESIYIDEDTLDTGSIRCPACGEELEFDLSGLDEEESADGADAADDEA